MRISITPELVAQLIAEQFPEWANLPVQAVEPGGVDNRTFRLGEALLVRLPSAEGYAAQVEKEQRWLPVFAPELPLPIPLPVAMGRPSLGYPFSWSVYRWIGGESVDWVDVADLDLESMALALARFLKALHAIDTAGGPAPGAHNYFRGAHPSVYDAQARSSIEALSPVIDKVQAMRVWEEAIASSWQGAPVWVHGDIAAGNLLVDEKGALVSVIDFGCMGVGDPACDLTIAWTLFAGESRKVFRDELGVDADTWARARGWALWKAGLELVALEDRDSPAGERFLKVLRALYREV